MIVAAVVAMVVITAFFTVVLQLYALSHPNKSAYAAKPDIFGLGYEDITLHTADGVTVEGWFVTAKVKTDAAIIVFHGNASNKSEMLPRLAFLASRYNLLFLDLRYFGSGGGYTTYGLKEVNEARAALNWLQGRGAKTVGLYGYSTGGTVALLSLAENSYSRCAAVEDAYADPRLIIHDSFLAFGPVHEQLTNLAVWLLGLLGMDASDSAVVGHLRGLTKPVLVFASRDDKFVPTGHVEALQKALADDRAARFILFDGDQYGAIPPDFINRMMTFYGQCLGPAASGTTQLPKVNGQ